MLNDVIAQAKIDRIIGHRPHGSLNTPEFIDTGIGAGGRIHIYTDHGVTLAAEFAEIASGFDRVYEYSPRPQPTSRTTELRSSKELTRVKKLTVPSTCVNPPKRVSGKNWLL